MWNRFDTDREKLNLYENPNFDPSTGITDREKIIADVESLLDTMKGQPHYIIKAKAVEYVLDNAAIEVNPLDWFGVNYCGFLVPAVYKKLNPTGFSKPLIGLVAHWQNELTPTPEFIEASKYLEESGAGSFYADYDHSVPDWDSVIKLGFVGMLDRANKYYKEKIDNGTLTDEQDVYYKSVILTYEAIIRFVKRILENAKKHENEDAKMPIMIECLDAISKGAPKTLYQFLMIIYLHHLIQENLDMVQVRTLGNLDADGYPFYKNDLENGILTKENVEELFRYFFERYANQGHQHAQPLYFGGIDENGDSLINELSYIMLDAYDKSCIVSPKLFVKVMPNTPDSFLKKALDMIRRGNNCIVFINEELGMKISKKLGRTEEETRRLVGTGCNNFASRGKETTPEHMYVNLAKGVELVFGNGIDPVSGHKIGCETGDVTQFKTFEEFKTAYIKQTECLINKAFIISDFYDSHLLDINPTPVYSGTMPDSVKSGKDAYYNGAKYNNTVMFLSCHATAADSLMMVKKHIFDKKDVSMAQLKQALENNWENYEELQNLLYNDKEKFGNNLDTVDNLATELLHHFTDIVTSRKNMRGGHFVVNGESIWFSHFWSEKCGATPDGRKQGDLLSKNMSASIGQDREGITAHIASVTKIDATRLAYGCPFDYILHSSAVKGDDGLEAYLGLLRAFMKRGGYGFQGNVQDAKVLKDAQIHPEVHKNLQVRISGWSWYFTRMDKEFQDEFIMRAELEEARV